MLGVCYYPEHWPKDMWAEDAKKMRRLGLRYVRIGEFAWSRLEPRPGEFSFTWLDEAIAILAAEDLEIVLGTPTATPPKWLIDRYPAILPVAPESGRTRGFGSRRHYDFSSEDYVREALRITTVLAQRYGQHPAVAGWQTDNELCCHDTTLSASEAARVGFQRWCQAQYTNIDELNRLWGNVFWSMELGDFSDIELPFAAVTETNPAHQLAFRRYASDCVIGFHNQMVEVLRKHSPGKFITHNFIPPNDTNVDNAALAAPLDFTSYDNYPLGRSDLRFADWDAATAKKYMRTGHPDYATFFHDQVRGLSRGAYWVMEQQPGPVNWARHNPRPASGMIRLWSLEAFAHGADCVSYFRWRQLPFAQEQMHAGLLRSDNQPSSAWKEIASVEKEIAQLALHTVANRASPVAMLIDNQGQWVSDIEQQGAGYDFWQVQFAYYSALRRLGLNVDFISPSANFNDYRLVVVPSLPIVDTGLVKKISESQALFVFGPRSGAKTREFSLPDNLPPGPLQDLLPIKIVAVETTRADCCDAITWQGKSYTSHSWREEIELIPDAAAQVDILARYENGEAAMVAHERIVYLGCLCDAQLLGDLMAWCCQQQGLSITVLDEDLRLRRRGDLLFAFNYAEAPLPVPTEFEQHELLLGSSPVGARDCAVWRIKPLPEPSSE